MEPLADASRGAFVAGAWGPRRVTCIVTHSEQSWPALDWAAGISGASRADLQIIVLDAPSVLSIPLDGYAIGPVVIDGEAALAGRPKARIGEVRSRLAGRVEATVHDVVSTTAAVALVKRHQSDLTVVGCSPKGSESRWLVRALRRGAQGPVVLVS